MRDEATDDHMTTSICLEELDNCKKVSIGPSFFLLLGQKYGYRPLPISMEADKFEHMLQGLDNLNMSEGVKLLKKWYVKDLNSIPHTFILQPISSLLPNFLNTRFPKLQMKDQEEWFDNLTELQKFITKGSEVLRHSEKITEKEFQFLRMSVIEREFTKGIVEARDTKEDCFAFVRVLNNISYSDMTFIPHFLDTFKDGSVDKNSTEIVGNLRDEKLPKSIYKRNMKKFEIDWSGSQGISLETHESYFKEFVTDFYKMALRLIDRGAKKFDQSELGILKYELQTHLWALKEACDWFVGREQEVDQIKKYITGFSTNSFVLYGPPGSGKTYMVAKVVKEVRSWLGTDSPIVCARVLGTSPCSTALQPLLITICKQICYNLDMPYDDIPQEIVPLKTYFKQILHKASVVHPILIFFDALEIFFVDEHKNGGSWIPSPLPKYCKIIISFQQEEEDSVRAKEEQDFLNALSNGGENILHLEKFGADAADRVLHTWLQNKNKKLTNFQFRVLQNVFSVCSVPLFCKLAYIEAYKWRSYHEKEQTYLKNSVEKSIEFLFDKVEKKFDTVLVQHALSYITGAKSGISDNELEDVLSLDDKVLSSIYSDQLPQLRRVPAIMIMKIKKEVSSFLNDIEADGAKVFRWTHKQFETATRRRYFTNREIIRHYYTNLSEYFLGLWSGGKLKPYEYTQQQRSKFGISDRIGEADRKVSAQPLVYLDKNGFLSRFNLRKFSELPFHLIRAERFEDLFNEVLFNYSWLHAKLSSCPLEYVVADFQEAYENLKDSEAKREVLMVQDTLKLGGSILSKIPDMLAAQIIGRLLPEMFNYRHIEKLITECDKLSPVHNALLPVCHCLLSPGGPMKFSLEGHNFAIFGYSLTSGGRYVISVSNKFLTWDLASSEICRDVDPHTEGLMLGLAVSDDYRTAAAFTSINQIVVLDVMLGQFNLIERPLDPPDDIVGLFIVAESVVAYNNHYWRRFSLKGEMLEEEYFNVALPVILEMVFLDLDNYVAVFWSGDFEYVDKRIEMLFSKNRGKSEIIAGQQAYCLSIDRDSVAMFVSSQNEALDGFNVDKFDLVNNEFVKSMTVCEDSVEIFQLCQSGDKKDLIATIVEGFLLWPLGPGGIDGLARLVLPTEFRNVISRPSGSNSCVLNKEKDIAIAGVREFIFVWNIGTEQLIKHFQGHYGRIIRMSSLIEGKWNHAVTSSMDRTIKVWDMSTIVEDVFPLDRHDNQILKILPSEVLGVAVTMTRSTMGIWDLKTGTLHSIFSRANVGAVITAAILSVNGKTLVMSESDIIYVWNLPYRAILSMGDEPDIKQIFFTSEEKKFLTVSHKSAPDTEPSILAVCRTVPAGDIVYTFEFKIKKFRELVTTPDEHYVVGIGYDSSTKKEHIRVYHLKKGVFLHRIAIKYPNLKDIQMIVGFHLCFVALIDNDKANVFNCTEKRFTGVIPTWSGQISKDEKYGLGAPNKGGLYLIDLDTAQIVATYIEPLNEGVFRREAGK